MRIWAAGSERYSFGLGVRLMFTTRRLIWDQRWHCFGISVLDLFRLAFSSALAAGLTFFRRCGLGCHRPWFSIGLIRTWAHLLVALTSI